MKTESKKQKAIEFIMKGYKFNKSEIRTVFRYDNVGDLVLQLRKQGHNINTEMKINNNGNRYAEYKLIQ